MSMLKTLKVKDIFQFLTGYLCPFFIGWLARIIMTKEPHFDGLKNIFAVGLPEIGGFYNMADIVTISVMALLLLISLLGYSQLIARKNIHAQKKIDTMYVLIFFSLPMAFFFIPKLTVQYLLILAVPISLFMAILIRLIKHPAVAESLHFILFVTAIVSQFLMLI